MIPFRSLYLDDAIRPGRVLDIFESPTPGPKPALFFVHGGGWKAGSRTGFHVIAAAYRQLGFECASTDYRLSGVNVFQQVDDVCESLTRYAEDLASRGRRTDIALIGSSAGAHLALLAGLRPRGEEGDRPYRISSICVQAAPFTFEPWPDIFPAVWSLMQEIVGRPHAGNEDLYRQASPISYITAEMPPVFALHAENEHMFPSALAEEFAAKAASLGRRVEFKMYPRTEHGFFYSLERWQQQEAFEDIRKFVESADTALPQEP